MFIFRKIMQLFLPFSIMLAGTMPAKAQATAKVDFITVAAGCSPTAETIQDDRYYVSGYRYKLKPGKTDAHFVCPINYQGDGYWQRFRVTWHDPDGEGDKYKVIVWLLRRKYDGLNDEIVSDGVLASGTGACRSSDNPVTCRLTLNHDTDFRGYYYWFSVKIFRAEGETGQPTFNAIVMD